MGKVLDTIDDSLKSWVEKQQMFFVASAPLSADGHINCSPKGISSLRITGAKEVIYQDLTGSGVETIAHIQENGRILIMLCSFEGPPQIVRFHGLGTYLAKGTAEYIGAAKLFPVQAGCRAFIKVAVSRISTSCGYSVPLYDYVGQRDILDKWSAEKGEEGLNEYRRKKNSLSIDGLPGLKF